ncbi:MAG: TetR/AcrR family transcriptional regulator [Bacteroidetes bacterium]|nr:TetR/AcrR family transcriptional regulator [Bacteroidota bacterium]
MSQVAEPQRRRPAERPDEILDAALEEFGARGLAGARMSDIARRANVSKGTVYLYFDTKDDLFRSVVQRTIADAVATLNEAAVGATAEERIRGLLPSFWQLLRSKRFEIVYRLVYAELHNFPDLMRFYSTEIAGQVSSFIADLIRAGIENGEFRTADPDVTARMLMALCIKHATWMARPDLFPHASDRTEEQVRGDVAEFFFNAIRLQAGEPN